MDPHLITPVLIAALVIWGIYRRMRGNFGRQTVQVGRMWFRIIVLAIVGGLILVSIMRDTPALGALLGGVVCGIALAYLGLRHTQFEVTPEGRFYTPHTYIGLLVTGLFVGRLVYRLLIQYSGAMAPAPKTFADAYQRSPLTLAIFGVLIGYYIVFNLGVLQKTRGPALSAESSASPGQ